ncbi:MAG: hypothetical protein WAL29_01270, partial [Bacteroidales bacterium]
RRPAYLTYRRQAAGKRQAGQRDPRDTELISRTTDSHQDRRRIPKLLPFIKINYIQIKMRLNLKKS